MEDIKIGNRLIGLSHEPFIIAEMSGNHNQSLGRALTIVDAAARAGAHAVKLQTYTADTMTIDVDNDEFKIMDKDSLWYGKTLYELYKEAHTPWEWHKPIFDRCKELGLICFSTPFDNTAVAFLESLNVPCYKVASFENTDVNLLQEIAKTKKPMIISAGMVSLSDLELITETVRNKGCEKIILLKCTSSYPASPVDSNILTIPHMRNSFGCQVGLSDHTLGIGVAVASVALGATVIEKHFTLDRAEGGVDSAFSLEPDEMTMLVEETNRAWQGLGHINYETSEAEKSSKKFKRSLYIVEDIKQGEILTEKNVRSIRPGYGLPPKFMRFIIGKKALKNIKKGTPLKQELIE